MNDIRQRALGAIIKNAVFSIPSALIVGAGIVLVGLGVDIPVLSAAPFNVPPTAWLAGLVPLWLGVVGANVFSKRAGEQAVSQMFREQFDVGRITNPNLRTNIAQAIAYRERIDNAVGRFGDTASRGRVQDVANQVDDWVHRIYSLATRLDTFRNDSVIQNDRKHALEAIEQLRRRLNQSADPNLRQEIADTIGRRQDQLDNLNKLFNTMERADLQLENTLTSLGTVYSQVLLIDAGDVNSSKTQRLRESISEQVNGLQDLLSSMDEVYGNSQDQLSRASQIMARK
jgi:archaellum component FlaC